MNARRKMLLGAAVAVPLALGGAGTAYAAHYQDRALPGSTVGGVSVGGMTRDQLTAAVRDRAADVTVEVTSGATTRTLDLTELGLTVDVDATVDTLLEANGSWSGYARSLVSERAVDAVVVQDAAVTEAVASSLVEAADGVGRDAGVVRAEDGRSYVVTPAVPGSTVDPATFDDVVLAAARGLTSTTTSVRFVRTEPSVTTARATEVADAANAMIGTRIGVSDGDRILRPSAKRQASWVTVPVVDGVPGAPRVDIERVRAWVDVVAQASAAEPTTGLRYVDAAGTVRKVVRHAVDGRTPDNAAALASTLAQRVGATQSYAGRLSYDTVPATWEERRIAPGAENLAYPAAVGEKWIDVDLGDHTMTAYVGADVVYGPISMVDGQPEKPTVTGLFHVYYKNPLMTMRGNNADGTRYETPDVPWSTFFHRGFALHGAPWRDSFGYSASHGCVNLPVGVAKWIYDFAPIGTPVASHY